MSNVTTFHSPFGWTYEEAACTACHTVVCRYSGLTRVGITAWKGVEDDTVICRFSKTGNHTIQRYPAPKV